MSRPDNCHQVIIVNGALTAESRAQLITQWRHRTRRQVIRQDHNLDKLSRSVTFINYPLGSRERGWRDWLDIKRQEIADWFCR